MAKIVMIKLRTEWSFERIRSTNVINETLFMEKETEIDSKQSSINN